MNQTFGGFVRERRIACGMTLRSLAAKLSLSPVYVSNIENDRRAAPAQEYLERLALLLQLDKIDREQLLDLAAKSHQDRVSADLPDYIMDKYGWSRSVPNLSGMLKHGFPRYGEAVELVDALGYDIVWQKRK